MIRYMFTGLTAAALCVAPIAHAKDGASLFDNSTQNAAKQNKAKTDLVSAWDIAPLLLFGGSVLYMYTIKKQCNNLEQEVKNQASRFDKAVNEFEKKFRAQFPVSPEDEDEKRGSDYCFVPSASKSSSLDAGLHDHNPFTIGVPTSMSTDAVVDANDEGRTSPIYPDLTKPLMQVEEPDSDGNISDTYSDVEGEDNDKK